MNVNHKQLLTPRNTLITRNAISGSAWMSKATKIMNLLPNSMETGDFGTEWPSQVTGYHFITSDDCVEVTTSTSPNQQTYHGLMVLLN